jgi:hypothetical protein
MDNVNDGIMVPNVRVVFPDGSIEVMPTATAVRKAQAMGLDLVLVAPTAMPPVAKAVHLNSGKREETATISNEVTGTVQVDCPRRTVCRPRVRVADPKPTITYSPRFFFHPSPHSSLPQQFE